MEKTIVVLEKELVVKKIPLVKYPSIIEALQSLQAHSSLFGDFSATSVISSLPQILMVATPSIMKVIQIVTDLPEEEIQKWGLDDFIKFTEALLEVNEYQYVYETIKKVMARFKKTGTGEATL